MTARLQCGCTYDRFKVSGINRVRCQRCGRDMEIDPTIRCVGLNTADRLLDEQTNKCFDKLKGGQ